MIGKHVEKLGNMIVRRKNKSLEESKNGPKNRGWNRLNVLQKQNGRQCRQTYTRCLAWSDTILEADLRQNV
ncbi:hypothetical protein ACOMHN_012232 [Nucella lapillus]